MKRLTILFALLLVSFSGFAQEGFRFGFRVSPLASMVRITDQDKNVISDGPAGRGGISAGLIGIYGFNEKVGLYTGLLFTSKGFGYKDNNGVGWGADKWSSSMTTLEIPLALHMRSNEIADGLRIRGIFGVQNNILLGVSNKFGSITNKDRKGYAAYVPDLLVGAGVEWELPNVGTFDLGISYHHGLGSFYKTSIDIAGTNFTYRHRINYIAVDLAYLF